MLSNFDLERLAKVYKVKLNGVFSKDTLPERMDEGWFIINLQNLGDGPGTHWVCYYHEVPEGTSRGQVPEGTSRGQPLIRNESVYFDSMGVVPPIVINEKLNLGDVINKQQIQPLMNDDNCGLYCIGIMCFFKNNPTSTNSSNLKFYQSLFSKTDLPSNQYRLKIYLSRAVPP